MFKQMAGRLSSNATGKDLGSLLQQDLGKLVAGCTMAGGAHDQLHVYLTAYMPSVQRLAESGDEAARSEVEALLGLYPEYFE